MMIRLLFFLFILVVGIVLIANQIVKFVQNLNHPKNKLENDKLNFLKELFDDYNQDLVLIDNQELGLLSLDFEEKSGNDVNGKWTKGIYKSIYQEPLVAYASKDYIGSDYYLTVVRTKTETVVYSQKNGITEVALNGVQFGKINKSGVLLDHYDNKIGALVTDPSGFHLIYDNNKREIHLRNSKNSDFGNQSAYPVVEDLDEANRSTVLILTLFEFLVRN